MVAEFQIPIIELPPTGSKETARGTDEWQGLCKRVRDACENFGCFEVVYDEISSHLREETFTSIRQLFDLPSETKTKYINSKPFHGYYPVGLLSALYESFGLEDASNCNSVQNFAHLMWPNGNHHFCQSINAMLKRLEELSQMIGLMIMDGYGLGAKPETLMTNYMLLRVMKYTTPPTGGYTQVLIPHTDKFSSVLLCEDQISGLEIETRDGQWVKVFPSSGSIVFIVGDCLMAWSNGRMHAVKHRVMMRGEKDRYSFGAFAAPVAGSIVKSPEELINKERPQAFKDFDYIEFLSFSTLEEVRHVDSSKKVFLYAALP